MPTTPVTIEFVADTAPASEQLARTRLAVHLLGCPVCEHYYRRRGVTLLVAATVLAMARNVGVVLLLDRYLQAVHARHLAGGSLSTRRHTPVKRFGTGKSRIRVQRSCNGCQQSLGDANTAEIDAAVAGEPLPDVRLECGCWTEARTA